MDDLFDLFVFFLLFDGMVDGKDIAIVSHIPRYTLHVALASLAS
jgi:hypothetical protein